MKVKFLSLVFALVHLCINAQVAPDVVLTTGHNDQVNAMKVTENGRFLASASNDKQVKIWELATGMEFRTISGMDGRVEQLAFSPDNMHLAGVSFNDELLVWNVLSGELEHKKVSGRTRGLAFSKDGAALYFVGEDGLLQALNMSTGNLTQLSDHYASEFIPDPIREIGYILDHEGMLHAVSLNDGTTINSFRLFDQFIFPFCNTEISADGKYIVFGFNDDKLRVFSTEKGAFIYTSKKFETKFASLTVDRKRPMVYLALHSGDIVLLNYKTKKSERTRVSNSVFNTQCVASHPNGDIALFANQHLITLYDFKRKKIFKQLDKKVDRIYSMAYDPTGRYLAIATDKIQLKIWDLRFNKVVDSIQAFFPCVFTPDGQNLIAMSATMDLGAWNIETGEKEKAFNTDYELIQSLAVSADGKYLAGAGYQNKVKVWELATSKKVASMEGHSGGILTLDFHPSQPWVASGSIDETARVWNYRTGKELASFTEQAVSVHGVAFSPDGKQLATAAWDKTVLIRETNTWAILHELNGHVNVVNAVDYSADSKYLLSGGGNGSVGEADNTVIVWDANSGTEKCRFRDHRGGIDRIICDPQSNRFFSSSVDGAIKYSDYSTCELIATYQAIGSKEFMIYTPDNYYIASRNALRGIAFRIGDKLVPFEQFDIHLNRPDIVAERIGKSSPNLIRAYHYLYKKRLKKLNIDEGSIKLDYKLPHVVNESQFDIVTTDPVQKLWVKAWDENYNLKQINVFVNNVPIFGQGGYPVPNQVKSFRKEIEIPLVQGKNTILISCLNSNGVESLYENIEIVRDSEPQKHDLYLVAIGVSDYKDDRFKLKYPTKDAQDMVDKFAGAEGVYRNVYTKLMVNEQVTKEKFNALADFFKNCTHEDMAIVFIAGHGVLNVNYDYFYGTHDMDFDAPEERGLAYNEISQLLDKIKSYQKLLIMDTCHSGELDKDEIEEGPEAEVEEGEVQFRGVGAGVRKKDGIGFENTLKISEDLFSDLRKGSGATVISSAGGAEYAMESDEWQNGLFTYVFLKGLAVNSADNKVYLSEIRTYVNREVAVLSNGKQIPTAREENISRDYIIFGN